jgi:hypothetical protein
VRDGELADPDLAGRAIDLDLGDLAVVPLQNSRGELVGEITI